MIPLADALHAKPARQIELLQDRVNREPLMTGLTADEVRFVNAYVNPGHGNNFRDAVPYPDGTPGAVFLFKSQWVKTFSANSSLLVANTPFFEAPFMVSIDGANLQTVFSPDAISATDPFGSMYMYDNSVYAYRCIGKSHTALNRTQVTLLSGSVVGCHKTPDVDHGKITFDEATVATVQSNFRNLQEFPVQANHVSKCAGGVDEYNAEEGSYAVSYHQSNDVTVRDTYPKKSWTATPTAAQSAKTMNIVTMSGANMDALKYYDAPTIATVSSYPDNTDVAVAYYEGLTAAAKITVKFTVVYELLLKGNSPLLKQAVNRPPANFRLLETLRAFECVRSKEANNGILPGAANFWSEIWDGFKNYALPVIGKVASTVFPEAAPLIKGVSSLVSGSGGGKEEKVDKDGSIKPAAPKLLIPRPTTKVLMKRPMASKLTRKSGK